MHAVRLHAFGPAENLTYEIVPTPVPAAGVHLLDTVLRQGVRGPGTALPDLPTVPGREVAGTVDALGPGTDPAWLGRRVVVHLGFAPGAHHIVFGWSAGPLTLTDVVELVEDTGVRFVSPKDKLDSANPGWSPWPRSSQSRRRKKPTTSRSASPPADSGTARRDAGSRSARSASSSTATGAWIPTPWRRRSSGAWWRSSRRAAPYGA
ncbi:hypothetical protein GCM10010371_08170 [Streptomyces subrutilus]|uniref:Alcohol dehydrogenase-like N-terminal domain-containing protein n=1 Tax=Streptomyces subrutilus TaxID=36818 RepID=A0A918V0N9_9ACTN|nr:hypothetical protein GCM10010371_08170 [Streptomyces subrutilus]